MIVSVGLLLVAPTALGQTSPDAGSDPMDGAASEAQTQTEDLPPSPVGLYETVTVLIRVSEGVLDAAALGRALAEDLDVHVALVAAGPSDVLIEDSADGGVRLSILREDGVMLVRETDRDPDPIRLARTVSLLVANLLRNESSELLALLRVEAVPVAPEVVPPEAPAEADPPPRPPPAPPAAPPLEEVPFAVDLLPGVGVSSALLARDSRSFSLGVVAGLSGQLEGMGLSAVLDLALGSVSGLQLSGLASVAGGDLRGLSLGGLGSVVAGRVEGAQIGGLFAITTGRVDGLKLSPVNVSTSAHVGLSVGLVNVTAGPVTGLQLSLVNVSAGSTEGLTLGLVNVGVERHRGPQIGLVNVNAGELQGLQLGLVNIASGPVRGLQLGLINVAEESDASIGLLSIHARARSQLRIGADTNGFLSASFVHGSGITRTIAEVSVEPFLELPTVGLGLGFGFRAPLADILTLDVEAVTHALLDESLGQTSPDFMNDLRAVFTVQVDPMVGIYGSIGFRVHVSFHARPELGSPILEADFGAGSPWVRGWPTLGAGVTFF